MTSYSRASLFRTSFLSSAALGAMLIGNVPSAFAQDAPAPQRPATSAADEAEDGEIVITAQRREERLKDVPIAITALSGETLENSGVTDARELGQVTPGLYFATLGPFAQPTIRGIGTSVTDPGADANVGIYIDGVYQPSQTGNIFEFNNIERIEVLKGPQGTLFGRNATGGAIRVITSDPDQELRAKFGVSYGRFDEVRGQVFINVPLAEDVAINASGLFVRADGHVHNFATGNDLGEKRVAAIRGKLKFSPNENLSFILAANHSNSRDNSSYARHPINGNNSTRQLGVVFPTGFYDALIGPFDPKITAKNSGVSLTGTLDVGSGVFTSITAYQTFKNYLLIDSDVSPLYLTRGDSNRREKTFTQEVNFASSFDGPFNFTAGVYYYLDNAKQALLVTNSTTTLASITSETVTEALSGYLEANYDITDRLTAIVGLRYSTEHKDAEGFSFGNIRVDSTARWNRLTPRAVLRYELTPSSNIYASWSRGFKSGNYNLTSLQKTPVEPEDIDAYEVGYKYSSRGISFNASAFYYDYSNIQVQAQTNTGGIIAVLLQNAATARSYGADAEFTVPVTPSFQVSGGVAWTHARYTNFPGALLTFPKVNGAGVLIGGNTQIAGDGSGFNMVRAPEFAGHLTAMYTTALAGGEFRFSTTGSYNDGWYWNVANNVREDPFFVLNMRASWTDPSEHFEIFAYGDNITSAKYLIEVNNTTGGDNGSPARPWTAGVGINFSF